METRKVVVKSKHGLHARPATELVKLANSFKSSITIEYKESLINAKDMFAILSSGIETGFEVNVICEGEDEKEALETLSLFIETTEE